MNTVSFHAQPTVSLVAKISNRIHTHLQIRTDRAIDRVMNTVKQFRKRKLYRDADGVSVNELHALEDSFLALAKISGGVETNKEVRALSRAVDKTWRQYRKTIRSMETDIEINLMFADMDAGLSKSLNEQLVKRGIASR